MSFRTAFKYVLVLFALCLAPYALHAQPAAGATVKGLVADPDNAVIPGATVTLTPPSGKATVVLSGSDGTYTIPNVTPGNYSLTVTMDGFATFVRQGLKLTVGQQLTLNAKLAIQDQQQMVQVTADTNTVGVDADNNASSTVISGKDLDALSDDPDELSSELSALAGPSAGPNGGQIYIDGFTGGQLPPKSSIREIRVNQNPFSAQYDRPGFGRVEVFTKPGTDKLHGSAQVNGNDSSFNSGNPPIASAIPQPPYHTIFSQASITGPLTKKSSYTMAGSYRNIQDNAIVNGTILAPTAGSSTLCASGSATCVSSTFQSATSIPQLRYDFSPRLDFALGDKNTLTVRFQGYENNHTNSGVGGTDLPSVGYNTKSSEYELQVSDTQIYSAKIINETRMELGRNVDSQLAQSFAPTVNVQGSFVSGGAPTGSGTTRQARLELQNYTSINLGKNFIRIGGRLRADRESTTTTAGTNGTFTYSCLTDLNCTADSTGTKRSYQDNAPSQYSITTVKSGVNATLADLGLYAETDWKPRPNLTISYGFRYETQNNLGDHHDFAPRVSGAYGLNKKTVLRAGYGLFYDRFQIGNVLTIQRSNGINQVQTLIKNPGSAAAPCTPTAPVNCTGTATAGNSVTYTGTVPGSTAVGNVLRTPYLMQAQFGVDQQLFKNAKISVNYINSRGVHQFLTQNVGTSGTGQVTSQQVVYQYQSEGVYQQNQLIANLSVGISKVSLFGYYTLNFARSDTGGITSSPTTPGNIGLDYGRAQFDVRNRLFIGGNITLPYRISLSPFVVAQSGNPFNITTGSDLNGDSIYNDRPIFAAANGIAPGTAGSNTIAGCGSFGIPTTGSTVARIPINYCTGPALFTFNLRAAKTFGFGPNRNATPGRQGGDQGGGQRPPGGGGPGGGPGGGGGGGGRGGGGGFPGGGGGANTGKRYNLTLAIQTQNLFNNNDLSTPNGTLSSPQFGQSTQLAGNIFTSNTAARRIMLQASFNF